MYEVRVVWGDIDGAGHVNNAKYLTYMESARVSCYFDIMGGVAPGQLDIILARATVDFRSQASMGETLVVEVRPGRVGASSFALLYTLREKVTGRLVAEGESVQVCFDYAKNAKKPVPAMLRDALGS